MFYREFPPSAPLASFVRCYWMLSAPRPAAAAPIERVLPDGCVEVILHGGAPFERVHDGGTVERQPGMLVIGPTMRHLMIRATGDVGIVGIRFRPGGAHPFLGAPAHELVDSTIAIGDLPAMLAGAIGDRIATASQDGEAVRLIEAHLLARLRAATDRAAPIRRAAAMIVRAPADFSMRRLSAAVGIGQRQLERRFHDVVGMTPKALHRLVRFQLAARAIERGTPARLPEIAHRSGFYDQAHLTREFRELSGTTPAAFARQYHEMSDLFTGVEPAESDFYKTD